MDPTASTAINPEVAGAIEEIAELPDLMRLYRTAVKLIDRGCAVLVRPHFELGRLGLKIKEQFKGRSPTSSHMTGGRAVELVGQALGRHRSMLRRAMHVVEVYSPEQLETFLTRRDVAGHLITPGHLHVIMPAPRCDHRDQLIEYFYTHSPTVPDLAAEVAHLVAPNRDARPKELSLRSAASRLRKMAQTTQKKLEGEFEEALFSRLREFAAGRGRPSPDELALVAKVRQDLDALRSRIEAACETASNAKATLEELLGPAL